MFFAFAEFLSGVSDDFATTDRVVGLLLEVLYFFLVEREICFALTVELASLRREARVLTGRSWSLSGFVYWTITAAHVLALECKDRMFYDSIMHRAL